MSREYHAYLLRCWWLPDGTQRVEIEHIATGDRTQVGSLTAAVAWITEQRDQRRHAAGEAAGVPRRGQPPV